MPLGDGDAERFDPMMLQMAQQVAAMADGENPIELLLDLYFGFLRRKTDFFDAPERCKDAVLAAYQRQADVVAAASASKQAKAAKQAAAAASKSGGGSRSRSRSASTDSVFCFPFSFGSAADLAAATAAARRALTFAARSADARTAHASRNPSAGAASGATPTRSKTLVSFLPLFFSPFLGTAPVPSSSR